MTLLLKDPRSSLDYEVDWGSDYLDESDLLVLSSWSVSPLETGGVHVLSSSHDTRRAYVTATGGVPGHLYRLSNAITTATGRVDFRSITLRIEER